jgi:hypothetical protein
MSNKFKQNLNYYLFFLLVIAIIVEMLIIVNHFGLVSHLTGALAVSDLGPDSFEYDNQSGDVITKEMAENSLSKVLDKLASHEKKERPSIFVRDLLDEALTDFNHQNYQATDRISKMIVYIIDTQDDLYDQVYDLNLEIIEIEAKGHNLSSQRDKLDLAVIELKKEQVDTAKSITDQIELELQELNLEINRLESVILFSRGFFEKYWLHSIVVLIFLIIISIPTTKIILNRNRVHKIQKLKSNKIKYEDLIKDLQKSCFVSKKISVATYKSKVKYYQERLTKIKHTLPPLESLVKAKTKEKFQKTAKKKTSPSGSKISLNVKGGKKK